MKRLVVIALSGLVIIGGVNAPASGETLFENITRQMMERYHLDTLTSRIEILSSQLTDTIIAPEMVRITPLFQKEPIGLVSLVAEITTADHSERRGQISLRVRRFANTHVQEYSSVR